jgi:TonB dependent receptor
MLVLVVEHDEDGRAMQWFICALATLASGGQAAGSTSLAGSHDQAQGRDASHDDVVVTGRYGAAETSPEAELGADEIDALDAYDIGEVIRRVAEAQALGETPVIIVNGKRIADSGVLLGFPPDALMRVEVLPRDAGARYAGDPSRRVLNIVLQKRFRSRDGQFDAEVPTAGGASRVGSDLRQGAIAGSSTTQFGVRATRDSALFGAERSHYLKDHPGYEAISLRPSSDLVNANLALTRALGEWSASINVQAQARGTRSVSLSGGMPIETRQASHNLTVIGGLSGQLAGWSLQASVTGLMSASNQSGLADTEARHRSLAVTVSANRTIFSLPAGPVVVRLAAQASYAHMSSKIAKTGRAFSTHDVGLNGMVSIPLWRPASPGEGSVFARALGGMSATLGANLRESSTGQGRGLNAGLAWSPLSKLNLSGAWSTTTESVSDVQRFAPEYYGSPITVFDFATGEAARVLPLLGGTPDLRPPRFDRFSLSAQVGPFAPWNLAASVSLQQSNVLGSIGPLPAVTPELEAAFPERFQRDAEGRLIIIDQRPINFDSARTKTLASNLGATFPLGSGMAGKRPGVLRVSFNHSWQLQNVTRIHAGLPELDRLAGDGGGQPRQQFDAQIDASRGSWGLNMAMRWRDGYRVRRESGRDDPGDLRVAAVGTVDLRLSYTLRHVLSANKEGGTSRRGAGVQFAFEVTNLFDRRPAAWFGNGKKAPGYGRDDQDSMGRTLRLTIRSRF